MDREDLVQAERRRGELGPCVGALAHHSAARVSAEGDQHELRGAAAARAWCAQWALDGMPRSSWSTAGRPIGDAGLFHRLRRPSTQPPGPSMATSSSTGAPRSRAGEALERRQRRLWGSR